MFKRCFLLEVRVGSKRGEGKDKDFIVKVISSRHRKKVAEVTFSKTKAKAEQNESGILSAQNVKIKILF